MDLLFASFQNGLSSLASYLAAHVLLCLVFAPAANILVLSCSGVCAGCRFIDEAVKVGSPGECPAGCALSRCSAAGESGAQAETESRVAMPEEDCSWPLP